MTQEEKIAIFNKNNTMREAQYIFGDILNQSPQKILSTNETDFIITHNEGKENEVKVRVQMSEYNMKDTDEAIRLFNDYDFVYIHRILPYMGSILISAYMGNYPKQERKSSGMVRRKS